MKRVKSDWRSSLGAVQLRRLMYVSPEGPSLASSSLCQPSEDGGGLGTVPIGRASRPGLAAGHSRPTTSSSASWRRSRHCWRGRPPEERGLSGSEALDGRGRHWMSSTKRGIYEERHWRDVYDHVACVIT